MSSRADLEHLLLRARNPAVELSATGYLELQQQEDGAVVAVSTEDRQGLVTTLTLVAAAADATAVVRDGGPAGDIVATLSAPATWADPREYPSGLIFRDGLYVTLTGAGASFNATGVTDAPRTS